MLKQFDGGANCGFDPCGNLIPERIQDLVPREFVGRVNSRFDAKAI
jgi:hypothetical protein